MEDDCSNIFKYVNSFCRLCLCEIDNPTKLPQFSLLSDTNATMLEALTSIKVDPLEGLSTITCLQCLTKLSQAYTFQQGVIAANKRLAELVNKNLEQKLQSKPTVMGGNKTGLGECSNPLEMCQIEVDEVQHLLSQCKSKCPFCEIQLREHNSEAHINRHLDNILHSCEFCKMVISGLKNFKDHMSTLHDEYFSTKITKEEYECVECSISFRYPSLYNTHIKHKHFEQEPKANIRKQIRRYAKGAQIERVLVRDWPAKMDEIDKNHKRGDEVIVIVNDQAKSIPDQVKLFEGRPKQEFTCDLCKKCFSTLDLFEAHRKQHTFFEAYKNFCPRAEPKVLAKVARKRPLPVEEIINHVCQVCEDEFPTLRALTSHVTKRHS